jgi:fidgetin-like protein 1
VLILAIDVLEFSAAFELARTDVGCVFANQGDNNVERIQRSKYFQALLQKSKANVSEQRV